MLRCRSSHKKYVENIVIIAELHFLQMLAQAFVNYDRTFSEYQVDIIGVDILPVITGHSFLDQSLLLTTKQCC